MWGQAAEYTRQSTMESITIPVGPRLGDIVIEAKNLRKAYGDRVLMDNLSFSIPPGSVVGVPHGRASSLPPTYKVRNLARGRLCRNIPSSLLFQHKRRHTCSLHV